MRIRRGYDETHFEFLLKMELYLEERSVPERERDVNGGVKEGERRWCEGHESFLNNFNFIPLFLGDKI